MSAVKGFASFLIFTGLFCFQNKAALAYEVNDETRLGGFKDQQKENKDFDRQRMSDVGDIKKQRAAWEKKRNDDIAAYKKLKARQAEELSEKNAPYKENKQDFKKYDEDLEKARKKYISERDAERRRVRKLGVSEADEYGLNEPFVRANREGRKVMNANGLGSGGAGSDARSSTPSFAPAYQPPGDFGGTPDFEPPPPPPPMNTGAPEFFEPESIPGIPPTDSFDEPIPPPIDRKSVV